MTSTNAPGESTNAASVWTQTQDTQTVGIVNSSSGNAPAANPPSQARNTATIAHTAAAHVTSQGETLIPSHKIFTDTQTQVIDLDAPPVGWSATLWNTVQTVNRVVDRIIPGGTGTVTYITTTLTNAASVLRSAIDVVRQGWSLWRRGNTSN